MLMSDQEILRQRELLDTLLATRTNKRERIKSIKVMDSIYFKKKLPDNVILFPLQRIKRYVHHPTRQSSKKNI